MQQQLFGCRTQRQLRHVQELHRLQRVQATQAQDRLHVRAIFRASGMQEVLARLITEIRDHVRGQVVALMKQLVAQALAIKALVNLIVALGAEQIAVV